MLFEFYVYGKEVKANVEQPMDPDPMHPGRNTVAFEARYLKWLLLEISGFSNSDFIDDFIIEVEAEFKLVLSSKYYRDCFA